MGFGMDPFYPIKANVNATAYIDILGQLYAHIVHV